MKALRRNTDGNILCNGVSITSTTTNIYPIGEIPAWLVVADPVPNEPTEYILGDKDNQYEVIDLDLLQNVPEDIYIHSKYKYNDGTFSFA